MLWWNTVTFLMSLSQSNCSARTNRCIMSVWGHFWTFLLFFNELLNDLFEQRNIWHMFPSPYVFYGVLDPKADIRNSFLKIWLLRFWEFFWFGWCMSSYNQDFETTWFTSRAEEKLSQSVLMPNTSLKDSFKFCNAYPYKHSQQIYGNKDVEELTVNSSLRKASSRPNARPIQAAGTFSYVSCHSTGCSPAALWHASPQQSRCLTTWHKFSCWREIPVEMPSPWDMFIALKCMCVSDILNGQITNVWAQLPCYTVVLTYIDAFVFVL